MPQPLDVLQQGRVVLADDLAQDIAEQPDVSSHRLRKLGGIALPAPIGHRPPASAPSFLGRFVQSIVHRPPAPFTVHAHGAHASEGKPAEGQPNRGPRYSYAL